MMAASVMGSSYSAFGPTQEKLGVDTKKSGQNRFIAFTFLIIRYGKSDRQTGILKSSVLFHAGTLSCGQRQFVCGGADHQAVCVSQIVWQCLIVFQKK
ncbi:hypothetical protein [Komagataeibacter sp. FXV3]|uniref:hypothetical protein n=1 Tax=Komagataeibacter sp. FXV3 TaxID=2608998 RepID=UPI00187BB648|nr:hypothetical protein [Komagataeibacter sp. FXV3]MBE7728588.1 hypothetical protein [Komagataeibacter sp. FXV3]